MATLWKNTSVRYLAFLDSGGQHLAEVFLQQFLDSNDFSTDRLGCYVLSKIQKYISIPFLYKHCNSFLKTLQRDCLWNILFNVGQVWISKAIFTIKVLLINSFIVHI